MGYFADRSDARKYVAVGMLLTAALNFLFGATTNYYGHVLLWTLNGFVQGMGYGPCTRGLSALVQRPGTRHDLRSLEHLAQHRRRHRRLSRRDDAPNIGAGNRRSTCPASSPRSARFILFWRMRDTPQSVGLPAVEEYKNDWPAGRKGTHERELSFREMFLKYILPNKMLWVLAIANVFVYIARYAMVDWGPTYLKEVKGASLGEGGFSTLVIEFAGAAGMLSMGWLSDKLGGRRARVSVIAMIPLTLAFIGIIIAPAGMLWLDMVLFAVIGFLVYVPVMFSGVMSLDLTSKKAVGTAAGFVGFFGYVGRVIQGKGIGWIAQHHGWEAALWSVVGCTVLGIILLAFLWNVRPRG